MVLDKDLGIKKVRKFHSTLGRELEENEEVVIDFKNIERIDLSVIQVIIAAGREAKKLGKTIKLKSVPHAVKKQMQICGLKT